jgi:hypothetical protein
VEYLAVTKKSKSQSPSKPFRRSDLSGPPPILEGEDARVYNEMLDRVFAAVSPTDFIEEIWARDLVDVTWAKFRYRRLLAALMSNEVWQDVNDQASSRAEAEIELMEGSEKEEMDKLVDSDSSLSWEAAMAKYPRANERYQELWSSAKSALNMDLIQARVMRNNLDMIERIDNLIMIAQRRIDEVIRELDRHRIMQKQLNSFQDREGSKFEVVGPKMIEGKTTNKKVA